MKYPWHDPRFLLRVSHGEAEPRAFAATLRPWHEVVPVPARVDIALPPGVRAVGVVMAPHMGESRDRIGFVCVERVATPAGLG